MAYDDISRRLILDFKHADGIEAAPALGRWLLRAGRDLVADADVIVPVALHWTRLFARRYNQAAILAHALGRITDLPVAVNVLIRHRRTPSQGGLSAPERLRNIRGAFALRPSEAAKIEQKRILLVDDVLTTGATVSACTKALLKGGARKVDVLVLARVN
jgi:ComF family protein